MIRESPHRIILICASVIALCIGFSWLYVLSINTQNSSTHFDETTAYPSLNEPTDNYLELSKSIDLARETSTSAPPTSDLPSLWWPALLFGLAFLCGWLARHLARAPNIFDFNTLKDDGLEGLENLSQTTQLSIRDIKDGEVRVAELDKRIIALHKELMTISSQTPPSKQRSEKTLEIEILKKKNTAKAEIISTLEDLVSENREKWLTRDETEAQMNQRIKELTDDLNSAIQIVQSQKSAKSENLQDRDSWSTQNQDNNKTK